MFNPTLIVIEAFIGELRRMYERSYGILEPNYPGMLNFVAQLALENIATSDAAYHDVNHTIMVTLVGQEILRGRHISVGGVTPHDWLHFIISLLGHDIGYVRGICRGDGDGSYVINLAGDKVTLPEGARTRLWRLIMWPVLNCSYANVQPRRGSSNWTLRRLRPILSIPASRFLRTSARVKLTIFRD